MKVLVVSGFLGAGKTTFLRELSRRTRRDFAVMENEYGQVGIDGSVLEQDTPELNIFELTEGCICCSMKSDFATSVLTIANTVDPEFLIVEPTGVGLLSRIMENLSQIQYERITLLSPITILDGNSFDQYRKDYPDILVDQISSAPTILVSKMESSDEEDRIQLANRIREIAPNSDIISEHYSRMPDSWWNGLLEKGISGPLPKTMDAELDMENIGLRNVRLDSPDELLLLLNGVVSGVFGRICRAKGYMKAGESWLRFDVAGGRYSITGCEEMDESRAVFIGNDLKRSWLRDMLQKDMKRSSSRISRSTYLTEKRRRQYTR